MVWWAVRESARQSLRDILTTVINGRAIPRALRSRAWSALGHDVHPTALINPDCFLGARRGLRVGPNTFINYGCFFDLSAPTHVGARCDIGYEVMFITSTHRLGDGLRRAGAGESVGITIGDGVWIGARVTVLPGVKVGRGCVIAAGAVVTTDCEPDGLYAGVPARRVRDLPA
ncbi:acyltransferase [Microbacterium sp. NPDC096154]|uniref:acyltransferase n=1 Tax=Microbacterium sp. NPDC096154 TaxID=3155549 RepID=UPI00331A7A4E